MTASPNVPLLHIKQGRAESFSINYTDDAGSTIDLSSGYTARMQLRENVGDANYVEELTSAAGRITLSNGGSGYNIVVTWTSAQSAALGSTYDALYLADLELLQGSSVVESIRLQFKMTAEVTR